ncbi:MAG: thioredoxin TrxC [Betaproteobacteria bacterium]|jgi:thioredoxin 2|nr:thioredoxin TrxC [Rubrivivax sp.]
MTDDIRLHASCPHCGATNRVPAARIDERPSCGRCGQPLLDGQVLALTDADFDAVAMATDRPMVVDFWAAWCGPCQMMAPAFKQAAQQLGQGALLVKVDTDANPQLAQRFAIRSIPTLVKIVQGREVARRSGALPAGAIVQMAGG